MILYVIVIVILLIIIPQSISFVSTSLLTKLISSSSLSSSSLLSSSSIDYSKNSKNSNNSKNIKKDSNVKSFTPNREKANIVFVGNLPFTINDDIVVDMIKNGFGDDAKDMINKIQIAKGKKTDRPLGYMFVHFNTYKMAQDACAFFQGLDYDGRTLNANMKDSEESSKFNKNCPKRTSQSIFLRNLDYSLTDTEIVNMCDDILGPGFVQYVKIPLDKFTKVPKGYAHIQFKNEEIVAKAITEFTGLEVFGRALTAERLKLSKEIGKKVVVPVEDEFYSDDDEIYSDYYQASFNGMV